MKNTVIFILLAFSGLVFAIEVEPYESQKISDEEWNKYHDSISSQLSETRRAYDSHKLEVFSDDQARASIAFTMPGHEAHPSWVTRHVVVEDGALFMKVVGYFAGNEKAFKAPFYR